MSLQEDEDRPLDHMKLEKEDLVARLMGAQMFARFILKGYSAKVSYDVDFMKLPEWQHMEELEETYKLRPYAAQWKIAAWIGRLDRALDAAIRRRQMYLQSRH
jgi:hypothetical protein